MQDKADPDTQESSPLVWVDTPWIVAALLGVWGVMLGVDALALANAFMVLAGATCGIELLRKRGRLARLVVTFAVLIAIVTADLYFTHKRKLDIESRDKEVPQLQQQLAGLKSTVVEQQQFLSEEQARANQKLGDISDENKDLKKTISRKDAVLESIAKDQYSLNFAPQATVVSEGHHDRVVIHNGGRTNIEVFGSQVVGRAREDFAPQVVVPQGGMELDNTPAALEAVVRTAAGAPSVDIESAVFIRTLDLRSYSLPFTCRYYLSNGSISRIEVFDHPIVRLK